MHCGRTTRAARQGRLQQWRRTCVPLQVHARRLAQQHQLVWQGRWVCLRCPCEGKHLHKRGCHPLLGAPGRPPDRPQDRGDDDDSPPGGGDRKRPCAAPPSPPVDDTPGTLLRWIRPKVRRLSSGVQPSAGATLPISDDPLCLRAAAVPGPLDRATPVEECGLAPQPPEEPRVPPDRPAKRCRVCPSKPAAPPDPPALGQAQGAGHHILHWGKAEWCAQCGRVTEAGPAGRAQQWRRPCHPLPSFIAKQQRGHRLVFVGHWQCLGCSCPPERLYRTRCDRARGTPRGPPCGSPRPQAQGSRDLHPPLCDVGGQCPHGVDRFDPGSQRPKAKVNAPGSAQGVLSNGQAITVGVTGAPIQSQLTRFSRMLSVLFKCPSGTVRSQRPQAGPPAKPEGGTLPGPFPGSRWWRAVPAVSRKLTMCVCKCV